MWVRECNLLDYSAKKTLIEYNWPGNVETTEDRLEKCRREIEKANANLLKEALEMTNGNKQEAAALLGMSRATFYRMMEKYLVFPPISE